MRRLFEEFCITLQRSDVLEGESASELGEDTTEKYRKRWIVTMKRRFRYILEFYR